MARRKQFKGICHDILMSFASRHNDLDGYWAMGRYVAFLKDLGERHIQFNLKNLEVVPDNPAFSLSAIYYQGAIDRMMRTNTMPLKWLADASIQVSIISSARAACEIEIVSDLGRTYRSDHTIAVRPHDPHNEWRRVRQFGPSNQKGQ